MDEVRAVARYVRISPRKVRAVIGTIKGEPVEVAMNRLKFMPQKAAALLKKVVKSAVANAEENQDIDVDNLVVKNVYADQGPTMKRFRARARGRATRILKRTAHITVVLAEEQV